MRVDLRSDTLTKPTKEMLEAMLNAEVGDDVFVEDPTINALEQKCADLFGKEAGLFCPSGTMTNQIAINLHAAPGTQVICDVDAHVYKYEGGGIALNSFAQSKLLYGDKMQFSANDVEAALNPTTDVHQTVPSLVCIENTTNRGGGGCWDLKAIEEIKQVCGNHKLKLHLDGARIFNALVSKNETAKQHGELFDTVSICLSKGLGTPVGSVLVGTKEDMVKARRVRKRFGGGMRQAGILAAAGIYALDNNVNRLEEDHNRAKTIANTLAQQSYTASVFPTETNIVIFNLNEDYPLDTFHKKLTELNIHAMPFGPQQMRFVTHLDFDDNQLTFLCETLKKM